MPDEPYITISTTRTTKAGEWLADGAATFSVQVDGTMIDLRVPFVGAEDVRDALNMTSDKLLKAARAWVEQAEACLGKPRVAANGG